MWLPFAIFSGLMFGVRRIYDKELTRIFGNFSLGFVQQVFALVPVLILFLFFPIPHDILSLPWRFWWPLLIIWLLLYPFQMYFLFRAIREGELSHVTPVLSFLPVCNTITSFLLIGEMVSLSGFLGIASIVVATYLCLVDTREDSSSRYNKPVLFVLLTTISMALGGTLDKISISVSTPVFYSFVNLCGAAIVLLVLSYAYGQQKDFQHLKNPKMFSLLSFLGVLQALAFASGMSALSLAPTSYTLAVRSGSYILVAFWGIAQLKESLSNTKVIALVLFALGTIALAVA